MSSIWETADISGGKCPLFWEKAGLSGQKEGISGGKCVLWSCSVVFLGENAIDVREKWYLGRISPMFG